MTGQGGAILDRFCRAVPFHSRQVQQQREARLALDERADRGAAQAEDEVAFPMAWHRPVRDFRRAIADHQRPRNEGLAPGADPLSGHPQGAPGAQAG